MISRIILVIFEKIQNLLNESGLKKDLIFMNKNTPKNINIIFFIFLFILSFIYFFIVLFITYFYFICYFLSTIKSLIVKKEKEIIVKVKNNFDNSFLFFYKEFIINYPKCKAFKINYNLIKVIKKKNKKNDSNMKLLIFIYFFKRVFKFITFIPFTIFKLNCKIYKRIKNTLNLNSKNKSSLKAIIDNILLNLYLDDVSDEIQNIKEYKIIIKNNGIEFNPPKKRKIFKNIFEYFNAKKDIEDMSEFAVFKNKKENSSYIYRHICKIYKVFKEDAPLKEKVIYTETKSKQIIDSKGDAIKGKLEDKGYKNGNIKTNKIGSIITETSNKVLGDLSGDDIRHLAESKNKYSWNLLLEVYYNKETLRLDDKNNIVKQDGETLKNFIKRNYDYLSDDAKKFVELKENLDSQNFDIYGDMTEEECDNSFVSDYKSWRNSKSDYSDYSDFYKKNKNKKGNYTDTDSSDSDF